MNPASLTQALGIGSVRYFTGRPCKNGHVAERFTSSRNCVACSAERGAKHFAEKYASNPEFAARHNAVTREWKKANRDKKNSSECAWRARNPEKVSQYNKDWRKRYPEKAKAGGDKWRANNPEKARASIIKWERNNPERARDLRRAIKVNRRTREAKNGGVCTAEDVKFLRTKQKGKCAGCGEKHERMELDHILAIANGGTSDRKNLQFLCRPCNASKNKRDAIVWAQEHHGRLL